MLLWEIFSERKTGCDVLFLTLTQSRSRFVTFDSSPDFKDNYDRFPHVVFCQAN